MRTVPLLLAFWTLLGSACAAILALDIGTDYTKAALVAPGVPFEIVMSADSKRKDVSGIAFKPLPGDSDDFERLYGSHTASFCTRFPSQCLLNTKPLWGKAPDDKVVQHYLHSHPAVNIVPSKNNRETIAFEVSGHTYPIEEVLAMNIQNIVERASILLKEKSPGGISQIRDVSVTVPSFFTSAQRNAIKDSVELAGLNLIALVDDGLAIAVNYATSREFQQGETEHHIIYDMGAGSTKATLASFTKENETSPVAVSVEGYAYDESLGGGYFTNAVAELIRAKFLESHQDVHTSQFNANHRAVAKLYQAADKAKLVLSANSEAQVSIESLHDDIDFKTKITRQEFEDYISDSSTRITDPINSLLEKSGLTLRDLSSVIYAGGSTRVPFVQRHLLSLIGEDLVSKTINADEAAVFGASLRAIQISKMFRSKELIVKEPSPFAYAVAIDDSVVELFPEGTLYGTSAVLDLTENFVDAETIAFDVIENAKRYVKYDAGKASTVKADYKFNVSDCSEGISYIAKFTLDESRLVSLDSFEAHCAVAKVGFFDKLRGNDNNNETESQGADKPKIKRSIITTKQRFIGPRPLGTATKQELKSHLTTLDLKDKQRKMVSEKLNELEAVLYSARTLLSDDDVVEKCPESMIEEANALVSEYLEWLDFESDGAQLKEIRSKLEDVQKSVGSIESFLSELSTPLDAQEFESIHTNAVEAVNALQEYFLTMSEEAFTVAGLFTKSGLDYENELAKVTKPQHITQEQLDAVQKSVTKTFEEVKTLFEDTEKLESMTREEKLQIRREALLKIEELKNTQQALKTSHTQKMKDLKSVLGKHLRAQKRAAAKEEAKRKESEKSESLESESSESEEQPTKAVEHDEL